MAACTTGSGAEGAGSASPSCARPHTNLVVILQALVLSRAAASHKLRAEVGGACVRRQRALACDARQPAGQLAPPHTPPALTGLAVAEADAVAEAAAVAVADAVAEAEEGAEVAAGVVAWAASLMGAGGQGWGDRGQGWRLVEAGCWAVGGCWPALASACTQAHAPCTRHSTHTRQHPPGFLTPAGTAVWLGSSAQGAAAMSTPQ